jgi:hypothetical protein
MVSEGAEEDGTVADGRAVLVLRQADRLGDQRLIVVDRAAAVTDGYGPTAAHDRWPAWSATKLRVLARQGRAIIAKRQAAKMPAPAPAVRRSPFDIAEVLDRGVDTGAEFALREYESIARHAGE